MFQQFINLFCCDPLSMIMLFLVAFIGVCVGGFALRYMKGDARYRIFFLNLGCLVGSIGILVSADHLALFFGGWSISNFLLVRLMIHKPGWKAARNSGLLAARTYLLGAVCVGLGLILLHIATSETSIKMVIENQSDSPWVLAALIFLLFGAMTQSAIWPFHRWLLSSLNSPTPVSAIMHAGLVNGGGFLLVRFAPLYLRRPGLLNLIFIIGIATALMGTYWKLFQSDVKRMLACSTMGQMGFMAAQCGLGLFPAAIAHLLSHGMFKAYLFLASGSAAQEKRYDLSYPPKGLDFSCALICGLLGSYCFSLVSGKSWFAGDSTLVLTVIVFLTAGQAALPILSIRMPFRVPIAIFATGMMSLGYGASMFLITKVMEPLHLMRPQALNAFHIVAISLLIFLWLSVLFFKKSMKFTFLQPWIMKGYVRALNASQPHPKTVTTIRNQYKYL